MGMQPLAYINPIGMPGDRAGVSAVGLLTHCIRTARLRLSQIMDAPKPRCHLIESAHDRDLVSASCLLFDPAALECTDVKALRVDKLIEA